MPVAEQFEGQFSIYQEGSGPGVSIVDEFGFARTAATASLPADGGFSSLSMEQTELLDADLLFFNATYADPELYEDPLWQSLRVVRAGRVVEVGSHWTYGSGLAVSAVLDDILKGLDT